MHAQRPYLNPKTAIESSEIPTTVVGRNPYGKSQLTRGRSLYTGTVRSQGGPAGRALRRPVLRSEATGSKWPSGWKERVA